MGPFRCFRLCFRGGEQEAAFRADYLDKSLTASSERWSWAGPTRLTILLGAFLYLLFGLADYLRFAEPTYTRIWMIRGVVIGTILLFFGLTFFVHSERALQSVLSVGCFLAGAGILMMVVVGDYHGPMGLMLVFMLVHAPLRMRFVYATATSLAILAAYFVVAFYVRPLPYDLAVYYTFHVVSGAVISGVTSYLLERYARQNFRQMQLIKRQKTEGQAKNEQLADTNTRIAAQKEKLKELDEAKSRLFTTVSHELRTPLSLIQTPLQEVLEGRCGTADEKAHRQLATAHHNAQRLERRIEQLFNLSQIEAGQVELTTRRRDLVGFVRETVRAFTPLAECRRITLQFRAETEALVFDFDAEKLEAVVGNLLANALKFTPAEGQVRATVAAADEQAVIRVRDTGPGIPEAEQPHIFDRFHRAEGEATREHGGTGIGLSIASEFVELHGGAIRVESEVDFGTTFTVTLPKQAGPADASEELPAEEPAAPLLQGEAAPPSSGDGLPGPPAPSPPEEAPTVLVVEDNADMRVLLRQHLHASYHLTEATNGRAALEQARTRRPELVVSDVMMPVMDGVELCRALKADDALSDVPVLLLTAKAGEDDTVTGFAQGADAYVKKPFGMAELKAQIRRLLQSRQELRQRYEQEVRVEPTGVTITPEEEAFLKQARAAVEEHLAEGHLTVARFAALMNKSKDTLNRRLKRITGLTPARFVRTLRLEHTAEQLRQDEGRRVYEVAAAVGYADADHFAKLFRKKFGVPPSQYPADDASEETDG